MDLEQIHISDEDLLRVIDGELDDRAADAVERHLQSCWSCRSRRQEIESAVAVFMRVHQRNNPALPSAAGPRALLKARLAELPLPSRAASSSKLPPLWAQAAAVLIAAALVTIMIGRLRAPHSSPRLALSVPNSSLTPGATILTSRNQVCSASQPNNRSVSASLERQVFAEYGISGAQARGYEVDYLITPALGGADDIHNLWPQSYSETVWNARVKDALENRLRDLVCQGQVDLATAQRDISADWIGAYKKYFQTDQPLETARP